MAYSAAVASCRPIQAVCFDWGGTLMSEAGPADLPMALWPEVSAIEGAHACLEALSGFRLAIATNASVSSRPMIERALARVGLERWFRDIFCFTELGCRKSELAFWQTVSRSLGVPLEAIAMIGDSLDQDVVAPASFGVFAVWFNAGGRAPAPPGTGVPVVTGLTQFPPLVLSRDALTVER